MSGASFAELKIIHDFKKIIMENVIADYGTSMYMSGSEFHTDMDTSSYILQLDINKS